MRLDDVPIPEGAEERAWTVANRAFVDRRPTPPARSYRRPLIAVVAVAALAGLLASPPGRALIHTVREAVGVKNSQPALFSLPAPGRILVESAQGPWVVGADGSRRLLGLYREASWSPFGRFVVAARRNELVALEPNGKVHWTLARPNVHFPRWGGGRTDTRIAYLAGKHVRVVAGDGTGDGESCNARSGSPSAWQPGSLRTLALVAPDGDVRVSDVTTCRLLWRSEAPGPVPTKLEWSSDGTRLLAFSPGRVRVYDRHGRVVAQDDPSDATRDADATFLPGTHRVAVIRLAGNGSSVFLLDGGGQLFRINGALRQVVASPDGRWLLLTFPAANQWIFVRLRGTHLIRGVSGILRQFGGEAFPRVAGWIRE